MVKRLRERLAYRIAPWVFVPYREAREEVYREAREEAFGDLAEFAYGFRDVVGTSPHTLVRTALTLAELGEQARARRAAAEQRSASAPLGA